MAFDYRRFLSRISLTNLSRLGCSREVLKHAACRYAIASAQPGERREGLRQAKTTQKQLDAQAKAARSLSRFLGRLQQEPRLVAANEIPQQAVWRKDLEYTAEWLESLSPFRPDAKEGALALALHVKQKTGQQHLSEICKLLNGALEATGLPPNLTPETLRRQITRANRPRAEALLRGWQSLAPAKEQQK